MSLAAALLLSLTTLTSRSRSEESGPEPARFGLLVGCSEYPQSGRIPTLFGPPNDIPLFADVLVNRLQFRPENITMLVGWPDDDAARPTAGNIAAGFEWIIEQAGSGDQVVILLAGHGTQAPISREQRNPLDPANPEPDGFDELFLPADVQDWSGSGLRNSIRDDQIAVWLGRIADKGAAVWIIFDCCHSGTMSRSLSETERNRGVPPEQLGIPAAEIDVAVSRARAAVGDAGRGLSADQSPVEQTATGRQGGIVAFYAAQSYERAPELPRPPDAERSPENYFGLFSYSLVQTLEQSTGELSYRELARRIVSRYRADRGTRGPTPMFEGDLNGLVLGAPVQGPAPISLQRADGAARISAGSLRGITSGSVLSVLPPSPTVDGTERVPGFVRATTVTPTSADVESISHGSQQAVPISSYPDDARCELVAQDLGEMRVLTAVAPAAAGIDPELQSVLHSALDSMIPEAVRLVQIVGDIADADWVLHVVNPDVARDGYGIESDRTEVFLVSGGTPIGIVTPVDQPPDRPLLPVPPAAQRVYARYPLDDADALASRMGHDFRKIYTWRNVWRVVGATQADQESRSRIEFEVVVNGNDNSGDDAGAAPHTLHPGQQIELRLSNRGFRDEWVTIMYLGADFAIETWVSTAIAARQEFRPIRVDINDRSFGAEGFVIFSIDTRTQREQPDYSFLNQTALDAAMRGLPRSFSQPQTPFEELMQSVAAVSDGSVRGIPNDSPTIPQIRSWAWITEPER